MPLSTVYDVLKRCQETEMNSDKPKSYSNGSNQSKEGALEDQAKWPASNARYTKIDENQRGIDSKHRQNVARRTS
uniref:Uncharacterized protein n=1 Tax=Ditylenchus dipsaci TaxID=166011 RepID=A0A915EEI5_9BILA